MLLCYVMTNLLCSVEIKVLLTATKFYIFILFQAYTVSLWSLWWFFDSIKSFRRVLCSFWKKLFYMPIAGFWAFKEEFQKAWKFKHLGLFHSKLFPRLVQVVTFSYHSFSFHSCLIFHCMFILQFYILICWLMFFLWYLLWRMLLEHSYNCLFWVTFASGFLGYSCRNEITKSKGMHLYNFTRIIVYCSLKWVYQFRLIPAVSESQTLQLLHILPATGILKAF